MAKKIFRGPFARVRAESKVVGRILTQIKESLEIDPSEFRPGNKALKRHHSAHWVFNYDQMRHYLRQLALRRMVARTNRSLDRLSIAQEDTGRLTKTELRIIARWAKAENPLGTAYCALENRKKRLLEEIAARPISTFIY